MSAARQDTTARQPSHTLRRAQVAQVRLWDHRLVRPHSLLLFRAAAEAQRRLRCLARLTPAGRLGAWRPAAPRRPPPPPAPLLLPPPRGMGAPAPAPIPHAGAALELQSRLSTPWRQQPARGGCLQAVRPSQLWKTPAQSAGSSACLWEHAKSDLLRPRGSSEGFGEACDHALLAAGGCPGEAAGALQQEAGACLRGNLRC